ncbi:MAG: ATP-binding cassette domain-containing protein, partial [Rhodobacteraceae bacterium]|nr:ATP-binding cassette domain-containing protein [Paracoccaceae bacterium]
MALLELQDLQKSYGALAVTQNFSLTVDAGDLVGILGPNGAGKTTLFNQITGTVRPDHGEVWFDGVNVTRRDASQRCRMGIARSFQVPHPFV